MAIISFCHSYTTPELPADAVKLRVECTPGWTLYADGKYIDDLPGPGKPLWTWETHSGLCIADREHNSYHDSDFYMLVWNPEKGEPKNICFATTRGWSYPAYGSYVDATPETLAAYDAWCSEEERKRVAAQKRAKALELIALRQQLREISHAHGVPYPRVLRLRKALGHNLGRVLKLFSPRLRSGFKLRLRQQVISWLSDPAPRYPTPLSAKQLNCI